MTINSPHLAPSCTYLLALYFQLLFSEQHSPSRLQQSLLPPTTALTQNKYHVNNLPLDLCFPSDCAPPVGAAAATTLGDLDKMLRWVHTMLSDKVCNKPQLHLNQVETATRLTDSSRSSNLLLVNRTGSGKTHMFRVIAVAKRGIALAIINLHSLSANQLAEIVGVNQDYGTVEAHHMDKVFNKSKVQCRDLIQRGGTLRKIRRRRSSSSDCHSLSTTTLTFPRCLSTQPAAMCSVMLL